MIHPTIVLLISFSHLFLVPINGVPILIFWWICSCLGWQGGTKHLAQDLTPNLTNLVVVLRNHRADCRTLLINITHVPLEASDGIIITIGIRSVWLLLRSLFLHFLLGRCGLLFHHVTPVGEHEGGIAGETLSHKTVIKRTDAGQLIKILVSSAILVHYGQITDCLNRIVSHSVEPVYWARGGKNVSSVEKQTVNRVSDTVQSKEAVVGFITTGTLRFRGHSFVLKALGQTVEPWRGIFCVDLHTTNGNPGGSGALASGLKAWLDKVAFVVKEANKTLTVSFLEMGADLAYAFAWVARPDSLVGFG